MLLVIDKPFYEKIPISKDFFFDGLFLRYAYQYALKNSQDDSTHVGLFLIHPKIQSKYYFSANQFPEGIEVTSEMRERPLKYDMIIHAERNIVYRFAREGLSMKGMDMYLPWFPCVPCAQAIAESGVKKLVSHLQMTAMTPEDWLPDLERAYTILQKRGVEMHMYDGKIRLVEHLYRGKVWHP